MKNNLLYFWEDKLKSRINKKIELNDETLRDGLQATYVKHPKLTQKIKFIETADKLGITSINIGFPVSGEREKKEIIEIANYAKKAKLKIKLECGGRMLKDDVKAIIDVSQKTGVPIETGLFIASSKIRHIVEKWDIKQMGKLIQESVKLATDNNLEVMFVSEDTSRSHPKTIEYLYKKAIDSGATRLCITDTVGQATPKSTYNLVRFVKTKIVKNNKKIKLDWHGHNDRGLALANALAAISAGADCIQATALGIGERTGNTAMEEIIMNLYLEGLSDINLKYLVDYSKIASKILKIGIKPNAPIIGRDIFKTATGVHAAAIKKAVDQNNDFLVGNVYSSIDPVILGRSHEILIGPISGRANVEWYLKQINVKATPELIKIILEKAKLEKKLLSKSDILTLVKSKS